MIIGIDGNEANISQRVGVGRYAFELLKQLSEFRISNFEFRIYLKDRPLLDMPLAGKDWQYQVVGPKKFWTQVGLPLALWKGFLAGQAPAVFFTPSHYAPRFSPCPRVISIMDLAFIHFPKMFRQQDLWQLKNWTAYSVKKASRILTISQSTKNDIMKYYQVPAEKVVVTYPGYEMKSVIRNSQLATVKHKYGLADNYVLAVGTLQPRKNYIRLIEAFALLGWQDWQLVIVGKKGWLWEEILAAPKKFGVEKQVKFLDFVPDQDLPALYRGASCFVMVSLYEGFGIPILEAMNFGCPVVAANISSLPELVGEAGPPAGRAGVLVDPYNVKDIARGITKAVEESKSLIKKGLVQCHQFSWEKCARQTLAVLEEVGLPAGRQDKGNHDLRRKY